MHLMIRVGMCIQVRPTFGMDVPIRVFITALSETEQPRENCSSYPDISEVQYKSAIENRVIFSYRNGNYTQWAYSDQVDIIWIDGKEVFIAPLIERVVV